eukprot:TRINITY_DN20844_c1_g2_i1.p1 TRINITY_DN20844_c1_g2~~TRINITY_DN20844_c1_g2_i1.p1  ORF type:complete len:101 (+),score=14.19 TRINITY_DN20844_c1_g2_i1:30-305(+)
MDDPLPIASSSHELDDDSIAQFSALTSNHAIQSLRQWIMSVCDKMESTGFNMDRSFVTEVDENKIPKVGIKFVAMAMIELNVYHAWEIKVM